MINNVFVSMPLPFLSQIGTVQRNIFAMPRYNGDTMQFDAIVGSDTTYLTQVNLRRLQRRFAHPPERMAKKATSGARGLSQRGEP
jgi:hypothetical protein